jgi:hypothetical protein
VTVKKDRNLKIKLSRETLLKLEQEALSGVHGGTLFEEPATTSNNSHWAPCCACA